MDEELQLCLQKSFSEVQCLLMITKQEEKKKKKPTLSKPGPGCLYRICTGNLLQRSHSAEKLWIHCLKDDL